MDAPNRGALTLVYFIAIALTGYGLLEMGLYWGECLAHKQPVKWLHFAPPAVPLVVGVILLVRAKAVAKWLVDKLE
jgi:H+/Cl- antiporter ClcA